MAPEVKLSYTLKNFRMRSKLIAVAAIKAT